MDPPYDHNPREQPGLEVVPSVHGHGQSLPEVRADEYANSSKEAVITNSSHLVHDALLTSQHPPGQPELASPRQRQQNRRLWIYIGSAVAVLVILGATLGGVYGSRAASAASGSGTTTTSNATSSGSNTTTTGPQPIRPGSSLSVAGWRKPDNNLQTYLFYQDPQNMLKYSRYDTSSCSAGNDSSCWELPQDIMLADAGTPLAASTILWGQQYNAQIEVFYSAIKKLQGFNLSRLNQTNPETNADSVVDKGYPTGPDTRLAAYWPWTVYQGSTGELFHVRNKLLADTLQPVSDWDNGNLGIPAMNGSRLAVVPTSTNFTRIATTGGYAVFYQNSDARLAVSIEGLSSSDLHLTPPWSINIPVITLPRQAPLAGFSVARTGDANQRVDTYILYLDAEAPDVNMLFTNSSSGQPQWQTARPAALRGVDPDIDLACLTMPASPAADGESALPIGDELETARCYFQKGGVLTEVKWSNGDWVVGGAVRMS
ncbi:hypothetical protein C8A01DRAFT_38933 [Parachaetomium inaequale]|uniref:Fucose-specific lectin n=1 Tax=Parachaetomium inaequale TaxID=2588326 RepID=A0AAN6PBU6_9PEZI|nr:hypothetical protein C8A01DRAFT_38933 [Parachaetomium inaequale]